MQIQGTGVQHLAADFLDAYTFVAVGRVGSAAKTVLRSRSRRALVFGCLDFGFWVVWVVCLGLVWVLVVWILFGKDCLTLGFPSRC